VIFVANVGEPINVLPIAVVEGSDVEGVLRELDALAIRTAVQQSLERP
jgi:hypothetical protein